MTIDQYALCPVKKDLCPMVPVCDLKQYTGSTYCVEWIKLQQLSGQQEHKEKSK